ncbi:MAG: MATE family efflux transporter [Gammaproteobacteria bacterium]|nr:MATE family efflux transporter [Gammaproteobacteria bacterium]MDH4315592.1 MATE family efflux transporter [Gammaproteobacteria bacterium]MDH5214879.1 MATE family efflux transporter [Gammaproteobacteria bacterium]
MSSRSEIPSVTTETRTILNISIPLLAAYLAEMGMLITDMIIVGHLGSNELAAVGLAADWFYVLLLIGMGIISIVGVLVAQSVGARDFRGATDAVEQGLIVASIMSIPVMLCIWYLGPALRVARQDPDVLQLIIQYSQPLTWCVLPILWFAVLRNFVTAMVKASIVMWITVAALALNLAINYALVFGKFGFPALGVVGAAYGTVIVNWLIFAAMAAHVLWSASFSRCRPSLLPRRIDVRIFKEILVLGLPVTGSQILGAASFTAAAIFAGVLSADTLAAQQIVYTVIYVALSASIAIGDAVRVRVAYGIGMRSAAAARQSATIAFSLGAIATIAACSALWLFPQQIVGVFLDTDAAANAGAVLIAVMLAPYAAAFQLFDGVLLVIANALRGLRDTRSPLWIAMAGYWVVGLGLGYWLCFPRGQGATGIWLGMIVGAVVAIVLMTVRYRARMAHAEASLARLADGLA